MATPRKFYILTKDGTPPESALRVSATSGALPQFAPSITLGDKVPTELYFIDGVGGYDSITGTIRFAISVPGQTPTGGTFWLGFGAATSGTLTSGKRYQIQDFAAGDDFANVGAASNETGIIFTASGTTPTTWSNGSTLIEITTDLDYNISAASLQTALNTLASIAAAGSVTVSGTAPNWLVQFNSVGSRATMVGDGTGLLPDGQCFVSEIQSGTTVVRERDHVRLVRRAFVVQDNWIASGNAFVATVDQATFGLSDYLGSATSRSDGLVMEVEVTDGSGNPRTYLAIPVTARNECVNPTSFLPTPLSDFYTQVQSNANFVQNQYAITGLTGGGSTNLDGIVTTSLSTAFAAIKLAGAISFYRLESGTDAESSPDVIRPDDYNGVSNAKVWKLATISVTDLADYEALTFSAAGNTDVTPTAGANQHTAKVAPGAGAGAYTRTLAVLTANAGDGTTCRIRVEMPASVNPTVEVRNATSGGTLLATATPSATAYTVIYDLVYDGAAWALTKTHYESGTNFRISGNRIQILDDTDGNWRDLRCSAGAFYTP